MKQEEFENIKGIFEAGFIAGLNEEEMENYQETFENAFESFLDGYEKGGYHV